VAVVIGRSGRNLTPLEARGYIAGYTIFNDWSARDLQFEEMKLGLGICKGKDFANTLGSVDRHAGRACATPHRGSARP
jgi:2-keto-4-pentenoate hydratase/2-oxohepta-3-ene-1,7-dioic acid hydratase in catechol pathway